MKGSKKSRHSRRRLPPSRSHTEFAFGARTGVQKNPYAQIPKTLVDLLREDTVPIVDDEAIGVIARQRFPELLERPFRRGMGRDVVVENPAGSDLYDTKT